MCGPGIIAGASLAATIAGGALTVYSQYRQGQIAQQQANYQAAIQRNNAMRANMLAADAEQRGQAAEAQERIRGRILMGRVRAALASSGQVVDEGSARELQIDQAGINELRALDIRQGARREAAVFRIQAQDFESDAQFQEAAGRNRFSIGLLNAGSSLLGTAGTVANRWYQFDRSGAFG